MGPRMRMESPAGGRWGREEERKKKTGKREERKKEGEKTEESKVTETMRIEEERPRKSGATGAIKEDREGLAHRAGGPPSAGSSCRLLGTWGECWRSRP